MCSRSVSFLSLPLTFTLLAFLLFLTAASKLSNFSSNEIGLFFVVVVVVAFFISRSNSFSVIHVNVGIKIEVERLLLLLLLFLFLSQKVREAMRFTAETHGCFKGKISSGLTWMGGRTYGRFSQNTNFLVS